MPNTTRTFTYVERFAALGDVKTPSRLVKGDRTDCFGQQS